MCAGMRRCPAVSVSFALFEDLMAWGPFAPIFRRPGDDQLVNWLGQPAGEIGADQIEPAACGRAQAGEPR